MSLATPCRNLSPTLARRYRPNKRQIPQAHCHLHSLRRGDLHEPQELPPSNVSRILRNVIAVPPSLLPVFTSPKRWTLGSRLPFLSSYDVELNHKRRSDVGSSYGPKVQMLLLCLRHSRYLGHTTCLISFERILINAPEFLCGCSTRASSPTTTLDLKQTIEFAAPRSSLRKEYMSDQAHMSQLRSIGESAQIHPKPNEHLTIVPSYINMFEGAEPSSALILHQPHVAVGLVVVVAI